MAVYRRYSARNFVCGSVRLSVCLSARFLRKLTNFDRVRLSRSVIMFLLECKNSYIESIVFARWQHYSRRRFEISYRF